MGPVGQLGHLDHPDAGPPPQSNPSHRTNTGGARRVITTRRILVARMSSVQVCVRDLRPLHGSSEL